MKNRIEELENMLEDVVNALRLTDEMIHEHGPMGTSPAELTRLSLESRDRQISNLRKYLQYQHLKI